MEIPVSISKKQFDELLAAFAYIQTQHVAILAELDKVRKDNAHLEKHVEYHTQELNKLTDLQKAIHENTLNTFKMMFPIAEKFRQKDTI